jgi:hypothetical protein
VDFVRLKPEFECVSCLGAAWAPQIERYEARAHDPEFRGIAGMRRTPKDVRASRSSCRNGGRRAAFNRVRGPSNVGRSGPRQS